MCQTLASAPTSVPQPLHNTAYCVTAAVDRAYAFVDKARLHETAAMKMYSSTWKQAVIDSHQGLVVLGWHLEALCGHPLRRHVLSPAHRLCIRLASHVLLLPAGNARNHWYCTALVLDAQNSSIVLSVKHRTHAPGHRHKDTQTQTCKYCCLDWA